MHRLTLVGNTCQAQADLLSSDFLRVLVLFSQSKLIFQIENNPEVLQFPFGLNDANQRIPDDKKAGKSE